MNLLHSRNLQDKLKSLQKVRKDEYAKLTALVSKAAQTLQAKYKWTTYTVTCSMQTIHMSYVLNYALYTVSLPAGCVGTPEALHVAIVKAVDAQQSTAHPRNAVWK